MCKKSIFEKLLIELTKECTFSVNNLSIKQIDGRPMLVLYQWSSLTSIFCKMVDDVVAP